MHTKSGYFLKILTAEGILVFQGGVSALDAIQAYYNGSVFVPLAPVKAKLNQPVLITMLEASGIYAVEGGYDNCH